MKKLIIAALLAASMFPTGMAHAIHKCGQPVGSIPRWEDCQLNHGGAAGTATLPTFPCSPSCTGGYFSSTVAVGTVHGGGLLTGVTANFTYDEACISGEPLTGTARGTLHLSASSGNVDVGFSWQRVGLVAVINGSGGSTLVGAALFVPSPLPACGSSTAVNATVAGVFEGI